MYGHTHATVTHTDACTSMHGLPRRHNGLNNKHTGKHTRASARAMHAYNSSPVANVCETMHVSAGCTQLDHTRHAHTQAITQMAHTMQQHTSTHVHIQMQPLPVTQTHKLPVHSSERAIRPPVRLC
eukprot:GDKI01034363.1.p1 GENE.GDKI01034363.1~~GDKI01034363.1.p1  ORF type:complete len:126 (+),score=22.10 GDKI01034363.1:99-476(+)